MSDLDHEQFIIYTDNNDNNKMNIIFKKIKKKNIIIDYKKKIKNNYKIELIGLFLFILFFIIKFIILKKLY